MSHHVHIADPVQIHEWSTHVWNKNEMYFVSLCARKKYDDKLILINPFFMRRNIPRRRPSDCESNKDKRLLNTVRQFEFPIDAITDDCGQTISPKALVVYVSYNPSDVRAATVQFMKQQLDNLTRSPSKKVKTRMIGFNEIKEEVDEEKAIVNPLSLIKSCLQKCAKEHTYMNVDIDDETLYPEVMAFLQDKGFPVHCATRTRGGYHILLRCDKLTRNMHTLLWKEKEKNKWIKVELHKDQVTPLPGTYQGGHLVHFVYKSW